MFELTFSDECRIQGGHNDAQAPTFRGLPNRAGGLRRKTAKYFLWAFLGLVVTFSVSPEPASADDLAALIEKALKLSGIQGQMEDVGQAILAAVPADAFPNSGARNQAALFIKKNFTRKIAIETVTNSIRPDIDKQTLEDIIKFYETRLGRKIGKIQEGAADPEFLKKIREARTTAALLDEPRLSLIMNIVKSENAVDTNRSLVAGFITGLIDGSLGKNTDSETESEKILDRLNISDKVTAIAGNRSEELYMVAYSYTFRSLDDKELAEFAAFLETASADRFRQAVHKGLKQMVHDIGKLLGSSSVIWKQDSRQPDED